MKSKFKEGVLKSDKSCSACRASLERGQKVFMRFERDRGTVLGTEYVCDETCAAKVNRASLSPSEKLLRKLSLTFN